MISRLIYRWNVFYRKMVILKKFRRELHNKDFTLLCNNCNGGIILNDLGLRFNTPTINMFFYHYDFFTFIENLDYYLGLELKENLTPKYIPEINYPIASLGDLELHFMHYKNFKEAKLAWDRRKKRINKNDIFIMWTFFGETDESLFDRFDKLSYENKIAFVNREVPGYNSIYYIKGFEKENGLGVITLFSGILGRRYIDQFDYIKWFNHNRD